MFGKNGFKEILGGVLLSATNLPEVATYWIADSVGGAGAKTFAVGVTTAARHKDATIELSERPGKQDVSKRVYYTKVVLSVGDYIALGDFSGDADPSTDAKEVLQIRHNPTMSDLVKIFV